jgi:hypothetical protein
MPAIASARPRGSDGGERPELEGCPLLLREPDGRTREEPAHRVADEVEGRDAVCLLKVLPEPQQAGTRRVDIANRVHGHRCGEHDRSA